MGKTKNIRTKKIKTNILVKNLPNLLTLVRLILVLPLIAFATVIAYTLNRDFSVTIAFLVLFIITFIASMITDFLDGYYARKTKQVSDFGKLWDPIADKFTTVVALILLVIMNASPLWLVAVLILRDIAVDGFRVIMAKHGIDVSAKKMAKLKTLVLSISIPAMLFVLLILISIDYAQSNSLNGSNPYLKFTANNALYSHLLSIPLMVALVFSLISGFQYFRSIKKYIKFNPFKYSHIDVEIKKAELKNSNEDLRINLNKHRNNKNHTDEVDTKEPTIVFEEKDYKRD